jgi:GntR family transcriptional regulator
MAGHDYPPSFLIMSIDREGPVPPYRQIAAALREKIADGTIPVGRRIPSMVEMEQTYGVARDTLRKAVQVLRTEGLVETVNGMGVYVIAVPEGGRTTSE